MSSVHPAGGAAPWPTPGRAWTAVSLLMAACFVSYIDRSILSLLAEPIKHALHLSDTQIGLLQGAAFSIFFLLMTFPAGMFADRGNRMRLIGAGIVCWSFMTAVCGLCVNFTQFFLARMGVASGEATLTPAAPSIISDNFPPERRTLPLSLYQMGAGMGVGVSLIAGGFVAALVRGHETITIPTVGTFEPWQIIFFVIGLPGLFLSLMLFLGREPARRDQEGAHGTLHELAQVFKSRRAYIIPHLSAYCLYQTYGYAYFGWLPVFFMRVHGWSVPEVGLQYGVVHVVFGIAGAVTGGWLARLLWHRGRRDANLLTCAMCLSAMVVPAVFGTIVPNVIVSVLLLGLTAGLLQALGGTNSAVIQEIAPNRLRGRVVAIYYVVTGLTSMTFGPLLIGVMNDHVFSSARSIGKSMSLTALVTLPPASALLFLALRRRAQE